MSAHVAIKVAGMGRSIHRMESIMTQVQASASMVTAKELQAAVADLQTTRPWHGVVKTLICAGLTVPLLLLALSAQGWAETIAYAIACGTVLAAWMITTHDAIHTTLTGWTWFDEVVPRLVSWPLLWVHGAYSEIHKIHHKMNGDDFKDPERVQWTAEEYTQASALGRFYVRHQWFIDIFVFAAFGLLYKTIRQGIEFAPKSKGLRRQLSFDLIGIVTCYTALYAGAAYFFGATVGHTFVVWFILERITGGVLQWRAHVEHYGLWGKGRHYFETQNYSCRNLRSNALGRWFFNYLNFHSVHHAFPRVPFYHLGTAHHRFMALYAQRAGEPLIEEGGYLAASWYHLRHPSVIGAVDEHSASRRRRMQLVGTR